VVTQKADQESDEEEFDIDVAEAKTRELFDSFDGFLSVTDKGVLGPWFSE